MNKYIFDFFEKIKTLLHEYFLCRKIQKSQKCTLKIYLLSLMK